MSGQGRDIVRGNQSDPDLRAWNVDPWSQNFNFFHLWSQLNIFWSQIQIFVRNKEQGCKHYV